MMMKMMWTMKTKKVITTNNKFERLIRKLTARKRDLQLELAEVQSTDDEEHVKHITNLLEQVNQTLEKVKSNMEDLYKNMEDLFKNVNEEVADEINALIFRSIAIISSYLTHPISEVHHLLFLFDQLILKYLNHKHELVRTLAIKCFGQFCALKSDFSVTHRSTLIRILQQEKDIEPYVQALHASFDITMAQPSKSRTSERELINIWYHALLDQEPEIRTTTVEGLAKILLSNVIHPQWVPDILSRLILMVHTPDEDDYIKQILTVFFPAYVFTYGENMRLFSKVIIPSLRRVTFAEKSCPYANVKIPSLLKDVAFFISLKNIKDVEQPTKHFVDIHSTLAKLILSEILFDPHSKYLLPLCKFLNYIKLDHAENLTLIELSYLAKEAQKQITNAKQAITYIKRFDKLLQKLLKKQKNQLTLSEDQINAINGFLTIYNHEAKVFIDNIQKYGTLFNIHREHLEETLQPMDSMTSNDEMTELMQDEQTQPSADESSVQLTFERSHLEHSHASFRQGLTGLQEPKPSLKEETSDRMEDDEDDSDSIL
mmetsp:Transcript_588/g.982  ORF Transcript_588/g.982 Transcript_588/m.982 type:complete len:544 (+) Transcript_588:490-2121(+)